MAPFGYPSECCWPEAWPAQSLPPQSPRKTSKVSARVYLTHPTLINACTSNCTSSRLHYITPSKHKPQKKRSLIIFSPNFARPLFTTQTLAGTPHPRHHPCLLLVLCSSGSWSHAVVQGARLLLLSPLNLHRQLLAQRPHPVLLVALRC